ncbi:MAG: prepilin peptidase [Algisphaera sp.]
MPVEYFILILLLLWGACVGSFLNVVIYRVPEGLSVIHPPSRCPGCEQKLALQDNVPVLGWLWLRGKCRTCKMKISAQYPLVEAFTALCFVGLFAVYYFTALRPAFAGAGIADSWPVLAVHLVLLSCMIAATMIDAKLFIIPLGIPWTALALALIVLPLSVAVGWVPASTWGTAAHWEELVPWIDPAWIGIPFGGTLGLVLAIVFLRLGVLPLSFADEPELPEGADPNDPEHFFMHPHPRREALKEVLFWVLPVVGAVVGYYVGKAWVPEATMTFSIDPQTLMTASETGRFPDSFWAQMAGADRLPGWLLALGGVLLGMLAGIATVWFTRILGTLMFGKEAMGLGDVHLMAAVGAVIGWRDVTLAFFVAPFFGLLGTALIAGLSSFKKGNMPPIPYGPYLCLATVVVMVLRGPIWTALFPHLSGI